MRKTLLIIAIVLVVIQFIRIDKTNPPIDKIQEYTVFTHTPSGVVKILKKACYDCHSNEVKYPWYSNVAPVSWFIKEHINQGKEYVNFSEFGKYNQYQKEYIFSALPKVIEMKTMPLESYLLLHEEARLSEKEKKILFDWFISFVQTEKEN